ncbi:MAG: hypothetical protein WC851_04725 [Candidatus Shapirobacteria bacterium]
MHFICRSFLGHTEENSWSQYWENEPDDHQLVLEKGHLFALVNIISDQDSSTSDLGHRLIDEINSQYFSQKDTPIPVSLKSTVESVVASTQNELVDISLTVAIVHQSHLYIAMYNSGYGFLVRGKNISKIIVGETGEVSLISGKVETNDLLFLCTSGLYENLTLEKLKSFLAFPTIQEIEESFLSALYTLSSQPTLAGLLVGIYDDNQHLPIMMETPAVTSADTSPIEETVEIDEPQSESTSSEEVSPQGQPSVYITSHDSSGIKKRRRLNIFIGLIILVALSVSIFFGSKRNQETRVETEYQSLKSQYQTKLDNAKVVKNINLSEAQTLAKNAKEIASKMRELKIHDEEVTKLIASTDEILSQTGSADSYQPQHFYDTTLINSSASYSQIIIQKNNLFLLDKSNGHVDKLDTSTKSQQKIVYNDALKNTISFSENNGQLYFLADKKIQSFNGVSLTTVLTITDGVKDFDWGKIAMWNGSIYLMGGSNSTTSIWKYTPSGSGFGPATEWVKKPQEFPSGASSFAINGQVWVITKGGNVVPYNRGEKGEFKSQIASSLTSADNLVTALNSEILAFTEKDNLVYVYRKDGSTASSYNFGDRHVLSIALDSATNRLFVLCGDKKIYQINL